MGSDVGYIIGRWKGFLCYSVVRYSYDIGTRRGTRGSTKYQQCLYYTSYPEGTLCNTPYLTPFDPPAYFA